MSKINKKGFTLIELLVVVAIIGLLSTIVAATVNSARLKARQSKRIADIRQIKTALDLYYDDNNSYPLPGLGSMVWSGECTSYGSLANNAVITGLAPTYLAKLPRDTLNPTGRDNNNCYIYLSNGKEYKLLFHNITELPAAGTSAAEFIDPVRPTWALRICEGTTACSNSW